MSVDRVTYSGVSTLRKTGEPENRVVALRHHEQPLANAPDRAYRDKATVKTHSPYHI